MRPLRGATLPMIAQPLLHLEGSIERALRMVLVSDRRAEQREDAVAGRLHHVALVAAHRLDHDAERRVNDVARLLRVEVFHQLRRALEVGEQRRHRLAFAVENRRTIWLLRRDTNIGSRRYGLS